MYPLSSLVNSLIGKYGSDIQNNLGTDLPFNDFLNNNSGQNLFAPRAYLRMVFLDEQFKFIEPDAAQPGTGSDSKRVAEANNQNAAPLLMQQKAPKNGWVFVYLSNESEETVYFDNLAVSQEHSAISEENHYYPSGLKIAALSAKAFNKLNNKYGYQSGFSEEEEETGWDEFDLRMYNPQIGRWNGIDPYDQFASGYVGMGSDPINLIDLDGGGVEEPDDYIKFTIDGVDHYFWDNSIDGYGDFLNTYGFNSGYEYQGKSLPGNFDAMERIGLATLDFGNSFSHSINVVDLDNVVVSNGSFETALRAYVNGTGDINAGISYGFLKNGWGVLKTLGTISSFSNPLAVMNPKTAKEQMDFFIALKNESGNYLLNYGGNPTTYFAGKIFGYGKNAYNAYANGDLFDASVKTGEIGFDVASFYFVPEIKGGVAAKGGTFGEKLFLSEKFGITSEKFGSSLVKAQGSLNQPGGLFKMGWSNVAKNGGGMQMRIGIGSKATNPNHALFHMYVPKTFVPNSFANPSMQVKLSLYKLGL